MELYSNSLEKGIVCYTIVNMNLPSWLKQKIELPKITVGLSLAIVVIYLALIVGITILLSNDPNWWRWHISYLGEAQAFSANFFNYGMMIGGFLLAGFSFTLFNFLKKFNARCLLILAGFLLISICIYLIGLFPRSYGILPHDIFGHAIYFIFLLLCLTTPYTLPGLKPWFYVVSYLFHLAMVILFIMYWTGISDSLYLAEVATFVFFIGWTIILIRQYPQEKPV